LLDQGRLDDHLGVAGEVVTAHERRMAHILVVDLEAETGRQQHTQRRKHPQDALAVGELLEIDGEAMLLRSSAVTLCTSAHTSFLAPGGGGLHTTCQSPCWALTVPPSGD